MTSASPLVSVIMPAYHSDATIAASLAALERQTFRDFETIVVNSSPEEQTGRIVREGFPGVHFEQSPVRLLPHAARNRGVGLSRGRLLVFTDPDCVAHPDWLERLVDAWLEGHAAVGGAMGLLGTGWSERGVHLSKFFWALPAAAAGAAFVLATANAAYDRELWDRIGPFDGSIFAGDGLLSWRADQAGARPWFEPRAVVLHQHREGLGQMWRQRLSRGREFGEVRLRFEGWSRGRSALTALAAPLIPFVVLARAGVASRRAGWGAAYLSTLPFQWVAQMGWSLGEARAQLAHALGGRPTAWDGES